MGVRRRQQGVQQEPVRVAQDVVLRSGFAPVSGVRPGQLTPLFDRTDTPSIQPRDQSNTCASDSSSSTTWCRRSHTPASCHSRSRRQAVCPDPQPSCGGRSRHRQPVSSTNKIPSSAARSSIRGRPPGPRATGRGGISGSISSQSRSSTSRCCFVFATTDDDQRSETQDHVATHPVLRPGLSTLRPKRRTRRRCTGCRQRHDLGRRPSRSPGLGTSPHRTQRACCRAHPASSSTLSASGGASADKPSDRTSLSVSELSRAGPPALAREISVRSTG